MIILATVDLVKYRSLDLVALRSLESLDGCDKSYSMSLGCSCDQPMVNVKY